jgi:hypothetical protein
MRHWSNGPLRLFICLTVHRPTLADAGMGTSPMQENGRRETLLIGDDMGRVSPSRRHPRGRGGGGGRGRWRRGAGGAGGRGGVAVAASPRQQQAEEARVK